MADVDGRAVEAMTIAVVPHASGRIAIRLTLGLDVCVDLLGADDGETVVMARRVVAVCATHLTTAADLLELRLRSVPPDPTVTRSRQGMYRAFADFLEPEANGLDEAPA